MIKVRAKQKGFYNNTLYRLNDVFFVNEKEDIGEWMEELSGKEAKSVEPITDAEKELEKAKSGAAMLATMEHSKELVETHAEGKPAASKSASKSASPAKK